MWQAASGARRVTGGVRLGMASPDVSPFQYTLRLGLVLHSPCKAGGGDQLGLGIATLQWVRHPGSEPGLDDVWVAGLRVEVGGASH